MTGDKKLGTSGLLFRGAQQMGLQPSWVTQGALFAILTDDGERYINFARSPLNSHVSISLAKNKYLTRLILERHGLPNIAFARPETLEQAELFLRTHKKIIVKPLEGSGARDIHIVSAMEQLQDIDIRNYIFERYTPGKEIRYLVLNGVVIAVYQSEYGTSVAVARPLECISFPRSIWDPNLMTLSVRVARILGLRFAAVDYLIDAQGAAHILEVNSTPDLKWFHAPTSGPSVDVARLFLQAILTDLDRQAEPPHADLIRSTPQQEVY
jgi:glutathione synthase/RimK-type ligase-like ATP-grasp enzyme